MVSGLIPGEKLSIRPKCMVPGVYSVVSAGFGGGAEESGCRSRSFVCEATCRIELVQGVCLARRARRGVRRKGAAVRLGSERLGVIGTQQG